MKKITLLITLLLFVNANSQSNEDILIPIPSPEDFNQNVRGYRGIPIVYDDILYLKYQKNDANWVLFSYNGTNLTEIPSPTGYDASGAGYFTGSSSSSTIPISKPYIWNSHLYLRYANNNINRNRSLFKFDGSTLTPVPSPAGYLDSQAGLLTIIASDATYMYLAYDHESTRRVLFKYDGETLTEIPNPGGDIPPSYTYGKGLFSPPNTLPFNFLEVPIVEGALLLPYTGENNITNLVSFNNNTLTAMPLSGYNNAFKGVSGYPIEFGDAIYFRYAGNNNNYSLVQFRNNVLTPFPSPTGYDGNLVGYQKHPIIFNNTLCMQYFQNDNTGQLMVFDGVALTAIPAPPEYQGNGNGYTGHPIIFNDKLYLQYLNPTNFSYRLFQFNGTLLTEVPLPEGFNSTGRGYYGNPIVHSENLYMRFYSNSGVYTLMKYDGNIYTEIPTPAGYDDFGKGYTGVRFQAGEDLYLEYKNNTNSHSLFKYDGLTLEEIANPDGYQTYGYIGDPILYAGNLYLNYRHDSGRYDLMKYTSVTLGIKNLELNSFKLFPNPVNSNFTIEAPVNNQFNSLMLYDMQGRFIKSFNVNQDTYSIDECKEGAYILLMICENGISKKFKIIKK